jgi:hypothetical protein
MASHLNVVSEHDLEWGEQSHAERSGHRRKKLGLAAGGKKLGCSLYEVSLGHRA